VAVTDDLFVGARILETARGMGIPVALLGWREAVLARLHDLAPALLILDLSGGGPEALELIPRLKRDPAAGRAALLGVLPHVQQARKAAALAAGCDRVVSRSRFTDTLAEILHPHAVSS
jgi:CheY-like chemotaxis protein